MLRNNAVEGLTFTAGDELPPCDICAISKLTRLPFPIRLERSPDILGIIHSDLCGPIRETSLGEARYISTLTDDYSHWTEVYFLKKKSDVCSMLLEYKNLVENTGLDDVLKKIGVKRRLTTTYTPHQNGVSERKNRTLLDAVRYLLAESNLPRSFWAEAVAAANHVRN